MTDKQDEITAPDQIQLDVHIPSDIHTMKDLGEYLWQNYHLDIETDPDSDDYENIYYNEDLRSICGILLEWNTDVRIVFWPTYYIKGETPETYFGKSWLRLLKNSDLVPIEDQW